jgi:cell division protein FtsB
MTTKNEKKSVKKVKTAKGGEVAKKPAKRSGSGERDSFIGQAKKVPEVDREKMAAFFSAGGLDSPEPPKAEPPAAKKAEPPAPAAAPVKAPGKDSATVGESKTETAAVTTEVTAADKAEKVPEAKSTVPVPEKQNLKKGKGEIEMAANETAQTAANGSKSESFNTLPIFAVLIFMAAFWLYYISAAAPQKTSAAQVKQSQSQISVLENEVQTLRAEVALLQGKLAALQKSVRQSSLKPAAAAEKAAKVKPVKDSSFDKAPVPFWRNYQHPNAKQMEKMKQNRKSAAVKPVPAKVDSFSKAPVPFWRKAKGSQESESATKVKDGARHDSSFDKAPIPFWRK